MAKFVLAEISENHPLAVSIRETLESATKQKVALIIVDKMQRRSGVATKKITYSMEEGQTLSLVLRTDGDVVQHLMNNKVIPLLNVMDYDDQKGFMRGIEGLALKLKGNQEKFNIKRRAARVVIPRTKAPALTVRKHIALTREYLKEIDQSLEKARTQLNDRRSALQAVQVASA